MDKTQYHYEKEWKRYRDGNSLGCLAVPVIISVILLFRYFQIELPPNSDLLAVFVMGGVVLYSLVTGKSWQFKCPRCHEDFDYSKRTVPTKYCVNCGLPRYYGSSHFWDYWGTKRGNEEIQKVKDQEIKKLI